MGGAAPLIDCPLLKQSRVFGFIFIVGTWMGEGNSGILQLELFTGGGQLSLGLTRLLVNADSLLNHTATCMEEISPLCSL